MIFKRTNFYPNVFYHFTKNLISQLKFRILPLKSLTKKISGQTPRSMKVSHLGWYCPRKGNSLLFQCEAAIKQVREQAPIFLKASIPRLEYMKRITCTYVPHIALVALKFLASLKFMVAQDSRILNHMLLGNIGYSLSIRYSYEIWWLLSAPYHMRVYVSNYACICKYATCT